VIRIEDLSIRLKRQEALCFWIGTVAVLPRATACETTIPSAASATTTDPTNAWRL